MSKKNQILIIERIWRVRSPPKSRRFFHATASLQFFCTILYFTITFISSIYCSISNMQEIYTIDTTSLCIWNPNKMVQQNYPRALLKGTPLSLATLCRDVSATDKTLGLGKGSEFCKMGQDWTCIITKTDGPDAGKVLNVVKIALVTCTSNTPLSYF